ncbi:AraC family transcriptional regulator [Aeromonas caviae]|uniref:AraC family transcriptional regulator n=1 Tax=Aeromonas caviae TaxID=648 RepID=UPI002E18592A
MTEHIERHLDDDLSLERLSAVAHFSPFHFHRQFAAYCGVPLGRYIQLTRLKRASYRLAFAPLDKVTDIALDAGFQHGESFSRAFKQTFGLTPSQFRQHPDWASWHRCLPRPPTKRIDPMRVDIIQFPQTAVAALTHQGLPERINDTAARFIQWRKATGGSPVATSRTYGLAPDDPATTEGAAFRFTLCGSVEAPVAEDNEWGVKNVLIPAGRCAVVRHHGSHDLLADCARALYRDWLPASGEELRDFPLFFHYHNFVHEVPTHELVTDIYLSLA